MRIVVLAGGIGGARFLLGVRAWAASAGAQVTAVVNTGDDVTLHGVRICPDLDSVMYTLGGGADPERGWGRADETWSVKQELAAYGAEPTWFGLGDRDLATHLVRTRMLDAGYPLSAVTEALCDRWNPGVRLLPATDDRVETHVVCHGTGGGPEGQESGKGTGAEPKGQESRKGTRAEPKGQQGGKGTRAEPKGQEGGKGTEGGPEQGGQKGSGGGPKGEGGGRSRALHFQEWWVRHRGELPAERFVFVGAEDAKPAPGVLDAIAAAEVVLLAPSNPVVSIAPILAIPGIKEALRDGPAPVVGLSPIIGGAPVRGMADKCLRAIDVEVSAEGVGRLYGSEAAGLLDGWLVDSADESVHVPGVTVLARPLLMTSAEQTAAMVADAVELSRG